MPASLRPPSSTSLGHFSASAAGSGSCADSASASATPASSDHCEASPAGPPGTRAADGVQDGLIGHAEAAGGATPAPGAAGSDAVTRIAEDVAGGRISRDEAVDRIIAEALDSDLVRAAPSGLRAEITAALEALVATDPHLQSLVRGLGPAPSGDGG